MSKSFQSIITSPIPSPSSMPIPMTTKQEKVLINFQRLQDLLNEIASILPEHYRLTLVGRNRRHDLDADIVLTDDDLVLAAEAIKRFHKESIQNL